MAGPFQTAWSDEVCVLCDPQHIEECFEVR